MAGIALLSSIFLFSRTSTSDRTIPFSQVELDQLVRDQQVTLPRFSTVSARGTAIQVAAETATPGREDPANLSATQVSALFEFDDGTVARLRSDEGVINNTAGMADLNGNVQLVTSDGYTIRSPHVQSALDEVDIQTQSGVFAESALGQLTARSMRLTHEPGPDGGYVLVFKERVKLIYHPQQTRDQQ